MRTFTAPIRRAGAIAAATPDSRNRYVDFLRAVSIMAVVIGHWLIAAPVATGGSLDGVNMLAHSPWIQWLTWVFQVMPVFFAVGGYSNTASWTAARRSGTPYGTWLTTRLRRLTLPLAPLLLFWAALGIGAGAMNLDPALVRLGSQAALVPVWFLSVYVVITALGPVMVDAWRRFGWVSLFGLAGAAAVIDLAGAAGVPAVGWLNYILVWSAIHQLGVAWRTGHLTGRTAGMVAVGAAAVVITLVSVGPYPIAMVGVPGADASNNSPPTLAMIAFGTMHMGTLLALETRARRMLDRPAAWTATVLVNGSIMTLYLWHMTAMVLVIGGSLLAGGLGLGIEPSTALWWATRPLWIAVLALATAPFIAVFGRFEQVKPLPAGARTHSLIALGAVVATCAGLGLLAGHGVEGPVLGIRLEAFIPALAAGLAMRRAGRAPELAEVRA